MPAFLDLPPLKLVHVYGTPAPEPPPPLEIPTPAADGSNFLNLPLLGRPTKALHSPHITESTNPGTSNPLSQNMGRHVSVDQTMSVTTTAGPLINSDGQMQIFDRGGAGQRGVTVTTGYAPLQNSDGNVQLPNISPQDHATSSEQRPGGLPMEARPDSQNATRLTRVWADPLPIATNVRAGDSRPGGKLPTTHNIR